jgi:hypothetical protein
VSVSIEGLLVVTAPVEDLGLAIPGVSLSELVTGGKEELFCFSIGLESLLVLAEKEVVLGQRELL